MAPTLYSGPLSMFGAKAEIAVLGKKLDIALFMAQFFASSLGAPPDAGLARFAAWRSRAGQRASIRQVAGTMADYLRSLGPEPPPV